VPIVVEIPALIFGQAGALALSLFDNLDAQSSLGFVGNLKIGRSLNAPLALESSAVVQGPYAAEHGAQIDRVRQTITLPGKGLARFYRLHGEAPSRITRMRVVRDQLLFDYEAQPVQVNLVLETAPAANGPYRLIPQARFDLTNRSCAWIAR